jgi:ankyrin repeat protein
MIDDQGYIDMISLLIEFGADVNAVNAVGMTPLMFAARQGHLEIVRLLIQHGGIINLVHYFISSTFFQNE